MSGEWRIGLFGCFKDVRLCVVTFIVPCYTVGRIAEHFGEDCILWGLLSCAGFYPGVVLRWRVRQERKLKGTMLTDVSQCIAYSYDNSTGSDLILYIKANKLEHGQYLIVY